MTKVGIIGAGPAGITAAYELSKKGIEVELFEASDSVGGLSRSIELWGQMVDLGPHRFYSKDPRVNEIWLELAGDDYQMISRLTRILYKDRFFNYPLSAGDAFKKLGPLESANCLASYLKQQISYKPTKAQTFEEWVIQRFGRRLYEIFFKSYSEKLWGIPCDQLDADFAAQRIKSLNLYEALKNAFLSSNHQHKTLVDQFAYPNMGSGMIYQRMKKFIENCGGAIHLKTKVKCVRKGESGDYNSIILEDGIEKEYDHIISSMPLTLLIKSLPDIPDEVSDAADGLKFRNTSLVYLQIDDSNVFPDQWIYVHDDTLEMGRITNFKNWSKHQQNKQKESILALEYWSFDEDDFWKQDEKTVIALAKRELIQTGLCKAGSIKNAKLIKIPRCYPVYERGYKKHIELIKSFLKQQASLSVIGRYGAFKYNNQDHSILMGLLAAENISECKGHDLWEVNTDYEYLESAIITEDGLTAL